MYKKVMIVDDSYIDRFIAETTIKDNTFSEEVVTTDSASSALEYLHACSQISEALPQLIFLDINMPEINGFEFLDAFENLPRIVQENCNIMMLSSSLNPEDLTRAEENRFVTRFLNKPLNKERLKEISDFVFQKKVMN